MIAVDVLRKAMHYIVSQKGDLFGLEMEQAIILRAKRPVTKKPARRALQRAS